MSIVDICEPLAFVAALFACYAWGRHSGQMDERKRQAFLALDSIIQNTETKNDGC